MRGPVLAPPCIRQRPLRMAGLVHGAPLRVVAPHRAAVLGSPVGLPFFSHPRRFAWGSLLVFFVIPAPCPGVRVVYGSHDGLAAAMNVHVFDGDFLLPLAPIRLERFHLRSERSQQPIGQSL